MRVEATLRHLPTGEVQAAASALEAAGAHALCDSEIRRDPLLSMTLAAAATSTLELATAVVIAFPRSPMVTAYAARNLCDYSGGRFRLGLGTQVRGHIERRFSTAWSSPGPQLRDYLLAVRTIWRSWQTGDRLSYQGRFYSFDLMTPEFDLGPGAAGAPRLDIAAVNPYNLELAGELCDGVRLHSFTTPSYVREVALPRLRAGAARAGRRLRDVTVMGGGFIATGATPEEVRDSREKARARVAFYGSTRAYRRVLEHHGWESLHEELRELVRAGRWDDLSGVVPDRVLDAFCTTAPYPDLAAAVRDRYGGLVDQVQLACPALGSPGWSAFTDACAGLAALPERAGALDRD
ncbi:MAG: TIGR03617 family F420-dependent LLM class oxidoreductase [Micromonosporaceae bacterium]